MLKYPAPAENRPQSKSAQEKLMLELSVLSELKKGAFLATKAIASGDDGERRSLDGWMRTELISRRCV